MARALLIAQKSIDEKNAQLERQAQKIEQDAPKVLFANSVAASKSSILVYDLAKMMRQNDIDMGGRRLFEWLRDHGYLVRRHGKDYNMPTQRSMEMGLFEIKETAITHSDGTKWRVREYICPLHTAVTLTISDGEIVQAVATTSFTEAVTWL